ncbi:vesicle-associated protein 4-2-like isoform X1 [Zingiber officinale]|uniref:vesicle-associated protein 4-2-like isoform X1 n=1 Tax=Zingiber officinale TaxID=94328 RepID=UPI001C4CC6D1|nr:vesicle-associated protein 4-2-like isoform X1 [Zingiber officinale]
MALADERAEPSDGGKIWKLCRIPFWQAGASSSSSAAAAASHRHISHGPDARAAERSDTQYPTTSRGGGGRGSVSSVAKSLLPVRRCLRLDPSSKLYFPYEPGKQVKSAIRIKNTSKSHVAFKFQTTSPKSCFMRPPGAILSPGESIVATVFKFVERPENSVKALDQKTKVKFKIVSLKVKEQMEYVPELFDEQKDQVYVEQILRVVFLNPERPSTQLDKLKRLLAEADATVEARKKQPEDTGPKILGEGLVIDEWKERRERYLVRQQIELVDSI